MEYTCKNNLNSEHGGVAFSAMVGVYVILSLFVPLILQIFLSVQSNAFNMVCLTFSTVAMITVIFAFKTKRKVPFVQLINAKGCDAIWYVVALLLAIGMFFGLGWLNGVVANLFESLGLNAEGASISITNLSEYIAYVVVIAVLPAVCEEAFFRGLILNSLDGCKKVAIILAGGLLFALYHCSAVQLVYQFIYGAILTALALKANSSLPTMLAHFLNNFAVLLFLYLGVDINLYNGLVICGGLIALALGVLAILFYKGKFFAKRTESNGNLLGLFLPYGILGFTICLALIIGGLFV